MNTWHKNYQLEEAPEKAHTWKTYESLILDEWSGLLNDDAVSEAALQTFFEKHPSIVPGAFGIIGGESGHYPHVSCLISQPPLPSYNRRVPDFMWLSQWSDTDQPVLIEIEAPGKRWFNKSGTPTADFTQATDQLAEWKAWFTVPENAQTFKAFYGLDKDSWLRRKFSPAYLLIYGRRAEANSKPTLTQKRGIALGDEFVTMTYDRLRPNPKSADLICVKMEGALMFCAVSVSPTLTWSPHLAADRLLVSNLEAAIAANPHISQARKDFLIRRLPYWNELARKGPIGFNLSHEE